MNEFYTYELSYPESMGGAVFYVGKGQGNRIHTHLSEASAGVQSAKCDAIRQIWKAGKQVQERKVQSGLSESEAYALECSLIEKYGMTNLTNVGKGGLGRPSQGRSVRLQFSVTLPMKQWLESQKQGSDTMSDVVFRLLEKAVSK